jgi:ATP/maltotriose-dependent transcriptional regulator MalT
MGELSGYAETLIPAYYCLAQKLLAIGDVTAADSEMDKGDEASRDQTVSPLFKAWHAANRVMFAIQKGDSDSALNWGDRLSELPLEALFWLQHAPARLLIARGKNSDASAQLAHLYERAAKADALGYAIRIRVYQALAASSTGEALAFLSDALRMGEPEGFVRTFVDEGKLLAPLLRKARTEGIMHEYTSRLLSVIENEERQRKIRIGSTPSPAASPGVLSEREMEVLGLVAQGLSDRQIASRLMISLSTAKTHVHRILEKLNATSRTQAITRARELKLV